MRYLIVLLVLFVLSSCDQASDGKKIGQQIAMANGLENFGKIEMLEFTFHAQRDTSAASSRHWQWYPKTNEVVFITDSATTRFTRNDTTSKELRQLNGRFTNDEYWLLYPLHLGWDTGFELTESSTTVSPISGKKLRKLTTRYNNKDGFTPADMYDLYLDDNNRVHEWAFHKSGAAEPSLVTTWEDYKNFNGLAIAQEHKSQDESFRVWFTGINVK